MRYTRYRQSDLFPASCVLTVESDRCTFQAQMCWFFEQSPVRSIPISSQFPFTDGDACIQVVSTSFTLNECYSSFLPSEFTPLDMMVVFEYSSAIL